MKKTKTGRECSIGAQSLPDKHKVLNFILVPGREKQKPKNSFTIQKQRLKEFSNIFWIFINTNSMEMSTVVSWSLGSQI